MANENNILTQTFVVSGNNCSLAADQYTFVQFTTNGKILQTTGRVIGILQEPTKIGEGGAVCVVGVSKLRLVGTVSAGQFLSSDSTGLGQRAGSGAIGAIALENGVASDVISVLIANGSA